MQVDGEISSCKKIKSGVREVCMLLPELFSYCGKIIMRNPKGHPN